MSSSSNTSIAKKARKKAEADFATWLMMAKLGGFDDLPSNAQSFLTNYRTRLETMSEAESTALAVREVYSAYYSELGGLALQLSFMDFSESMGNHDSNIVDADRVD
jgi:hypothetical protein